MRNHLRTDLRVTERRKSIAARYRSGDTQTQIAAQLGVNQSTVSRDLKAIRKEWQAEALHDFDFAQHLSIARLTRLKQEAWKAIDESPTPDHRHLALALNCIKEECKILGLYAEDRRSA